MRHGASPLLPRSCRMSHFDPLTRVCVPGHRLKRRLRPELTARLACGPRIANASRLTQSPESLPRTACSATRRIALRSSLPVPRIGIASTLMKLSRRGMNRLGSPRAPKLFEGLVDLAVVERVQDDQLFSLAFVADGRDGEDLRRRPRRPAGALLRSGRAAPSRRRSSRTARAGR